MIKLWGILFVSLAVLAAPSSNRTTVTDYIKRGTTVITVPLNFGADTMVLRTTSDTLMNKTMDGGTNTWTNIPANTALTGVTPYANGGTNGSSQSAAQINMSPMSTLGDIPYENSSPAPARLPGNTTSTKNFLTQTGTGTVSAAPAWGTIAAGDVPANLSSLTTAGSLTTVGTIGTGVWQGTPVVVSYGGTGDSSFTAYAPVVGGTTTTGVLQSASSGMSNVGYVLTSTGSSSLPTWQAPGSPTFSGLTQYAVMYASSATTAATLSSTGSSGNVLTSGGNAAAPSWVATMTPSVTAETSTGSATGYWFTLSGAATVGSGCVFSNNSQNYTAIASTSSSTYLFMSGHAALSGTTLTYVSGGSGCNSASNLTYTGTPVSMGFYTLPSGTQFLEIIAVGDGGGGGGSASASSAAGAGGGGGGGGVGISYVTSPSGTFYFSVGTGGSGASAGGNNGTNGTGTAIANAGLGWFIANGGGGGGGSGTSTTPATTSYGSGGSVSGSAYTYGTSGSPGTLGVITSGTAAYSGSGGASALGYGPGAGAATGANGNGGGTYGGGGGGGSEVSNGGTKSGGSGAAGLVVFKAYGYELQ